jgi:hypothetical protein
MTDHYVEAGSLSIAWARAVRIARRRSESEIGPLTISITSFDNQGVVEEAPSIRHAIDALLSTASKQTIETVANTIFPASLWNPRASRDQLYERYARVTPRIKHASTKNRRGVYFDRMITGGPRGAENQLEHAISMFLSRDSVRRSALQIATFDPGRDHSTSAQLGFPCLQHVTFAPCDGALNVNAFYATQYLVERAYGNYLGLCRLGRFVAHSLEMPLGRFTCLVGIAQAEQPFSNKKLKPVFDALDVLEPPAR